MKTFISYQKLKRSQMCLLVTIGNGQNPTRFSAVIYICGPLNLWENFMQETTRNDNKVYFPFYPNNWISSDELNLCSPGAQALWIKCLCRMWFSPIRGHLLKPNGTEYTLKELAMVTCFNHQDVDIWITELKQNKVCEYIGNIELISRFMVKLQKLMESKSKAGALGGRPKKVKANQKHEPKQKDKKKEKQNESLMTSDNDNDNEVDIESENSKDFNRGVRGEIKPEYLILATNLSIAIKKNFPKSKLRDIQKDAYIIRLMIERDKRDIFDLEKIIQKLTDDPLWFWSKNIGSPEALRKPCKDGSDKFARIITEIDKKLLPYSEITAHNIEIGKQWLERGDQ